MKKLILLALTVMIMAGCKDEKYSRVEDGEKIVTIDNCEYIYNSVYCGHVYIHKGNCKYCAERRNKELEELVVKLKEK